MHSLKLLESSGIKHIHFVGIGGISMSGLAEILLQLGYRISGSDIKSSSITQKLEKLGIAFTPFHSEENITNPDLVVHTAAVKDDNPEVAKAKKLGITVIDRATLLGEIMRRYPYSIAVSGTHGKTTTTSMISMIMMESGCDPTIHIGGELDAIGGNTRIGGQNYFIAEACEYVESFLKFHPYMAVVLNIEADHLDYFRDIQHIKQSFKSFISLVPSNGYVVGCLDDKNVAELMEKVNCNKVTYGINSPDALWTASDIEFDYMGCASYKAFYKGSFFSDIKLNIPGIHNVSNSLAAIAACQAIGCHAESIRRGLLGFFGTHRRFELKGIVNGVRVVDDYAHHPSEVKATLKAARNTSHKRIWCVFQPHTYTRTKSLMNEFAASFDDADAVIVTDIYAAREKDPGDVHSSELAEKIKCSGKCCMYMKSFDEIVDCLMENAQSGDIILTMGAGDIYRVSEMFVSRSSNDAGKLTDKTAKI
ncbi:MAG: UDP-N-acetylmuramate--L-alanine ligase [Clostridia bacterium]|nr:UDP-N-acetylmuramate--L-alanine ligase [Clostridia bacterium]